MEPWLRCSLCVFEFFIFFPSSFTVASFPCVLFTDFHKLRIKQKMLGTIKVLQLGRASYLHLNITSCHLYTASLPIHNTLYRVAASTCEVYHRVLMKPYIYLQGIISTVSHWSQRFLNFCNNVISFARLMRKQQDEVQTVMDQCDSHRTGWFIPTLSWSTYRTASQTE